MIEFNPEPDEQLKNRFKGALEVSYNVEAVIKNLQETPGNNPKNIFDFNDGIRVIASRDYNGHMEVIHFSASISKVLFKTEVKSPDDLLTIMVNKIKFLCGRSPIFIKFSDKYIPHWYVPFTNLN